MKPETRRTRTALTKGFLHCPGMVTFFGGTDLLETCLEGLLVLLGDTTRSAGAEAEGGQVEVVNLTIAMGARERKRTHRPHLVVRSMQ